jgi:hypothetical protein
MGNLFDCPEDKIRFGMPVKLSYEDVNDEITLPVFAPAEPL